MPMMRIRIVSSRAALSDQVSARDGWSGRRVPGRSTLPLRQIAADQSGQMSQNADGRAIQLPLAAALRPGHAFGRIPIYPARLTLGRRDDAHEQEAERQADQLARATAPALQRSPGDAVESRSFASATAFEVPPLVHAALRSSGRPLDEPARRSMEAYFGHDFGRVRIHTDALAAASADALDARAYTSGNHIVFGDAEHAPGTVAGRRLLAHELTHVIQQEGSPHHIQRYPKGPGTLTPEVEKRVDAALERMRRSSLAYEVAAANDILSGAIDIAFPDFVDTTVTPPVPLAVTSALNRKQQWELKTLAEPGIKAFVPGTQRDIPIRKGMDAITLQHGAYDGVIYLFALLPPANLATVLLHESLHLLHPLAIRQGDAGWERERFLAELRSYYYATYRNVGDPELRFERAARDAEKDTGYLLGAGLSVEQLLPQRETWLAEAGAP
jgi:hypothetical protein